MPETADITTNVEPESLGPSQDMAAQFQELKRRELDKGAILGRFVILSYLDQGGMGAVYSAYDPELDRKVAIKLLLPAQAHDSTAAQARLLREAQAMARLDDPNVVAIHDVGVYGDQIWLAMEYVEGETLKRWLNKPRRWPDVLRVMLAVGRGLAAAHAKGLVHRDIKPTNIMISAGDRARVMDFGLACAPVVPLSLAASAADVASPTREVDIMAAPVTRTGAIVGTAGYMAPEQHDGKPVDVRADQFAFCVTIWEALYGERPFAGSTLEELAANIRRGKPRPPPPGNRVPAWLHRAMLRAFLPDPKSRYDSMAVLLDILERGRTRARVRIASAMLVGAAALAAVFWTWKVADRAHRIALCQEEGESINHVWNKESREGLRKGLVETGVTYASTTVERSLPWLDDYSQAWKKAKIDVCRRESVERTWNSTIAADATACLDEGREHLATLIERFSNPGTDKIGRGVVEGAVGAVTQIPMPSQCIDELWLRTRPRLPDDPEARQEIRRLRAVVARLNALDDAGLFREGLTRAEEAQTDADKLGWAPLRGLIALRRGAFLSEMGEYKKAEKMLEMAFTTIGASGDDSYIDAAATLAFTVGQEQGRHDDGLRWANIAYMLLERAGAPADDIRWAKVTMPLGVMHFAKENYDEARVLFERTLTRYEDKLGHDHPYVTQPLTNLALVDVKTGAFDSAAKRLERVLSIREAVLGREHPLVATALFNLANVRLEQHRVDDTTLELYERALAIREAALGADHPRVADVLGNMGILYESRGERRRAIDLSERELAIRESSLPANHSHALATAYALAARHSNLGEYDRAVELYEQVIRGREQALGPEHPDVAMAVGGLGSVYLEKGDYERAIPPLDRCLKILEKTVGPEHPNAAYPLLALGVAHVRRGNFSDARPLLVRALSIWEKNDADPANIAEARFALARSIWIEPRQRSRALELATQARDGYRAATGPHDKQINEIETWLKRPAALNRRPSE